MTLALVAAGGAFGATARFVMEGVVMAIGGSTLLAVVLVNALGAFLLGWAFVGLDSRAARLMAAERAFTDLPEARSRHRILAAFLATGFCGAFTTYSSLARELLPLVRTGAWLVGASWLTGILAIGLVALATGIRTGRRFRN